jgi:hypothetical protein
MGASERQEGGGMNSPALDDMLTKEQAAAWLKMTEPKLAAESQSIPPFKISHKVVRYHPRTIIASLANRAKVPAHVIAASFGIDLQIAGTQTLQEVCEKKGFRCA